jgi:antirestriction protein ArdC
MSYNKVYDYVTERIIEKMKEEKIAPWQVPWTMGIGNQINYITRKPYRGVNTLLLSKPGEYLTFNQIKEKGGKIKKGSKSEMVIFFKPVKQKTDEEDEEQKNQYVVLRYYKVFHLDNVEGIKSKIEPKEKINNNSITKAENIIKNYKDCPKIVHNNPSEAYYNIGLDYINTPDINSCRSSESYYSTLFHEITHSTGSKKRLKRFKKGEKMKFGNEVYSKEELIAEIGSAMLCGITGIIDKTINNSVSYLDNWIKQLENDKTLIVKASAKAQASSDYILGINKEPHSWQNEKLNNKTVPV